MTIWPRAFWTSAGLTGGLVSQKGPVGTSGRRTPLDPLIPIFTKLDGCPETAPADVELRSFWMRTPGTSQHASSRRARPRWEKELGDKKLTPLSSEYAASSGFRLPLCVRSESRPCLRAPVSINGAKPLKLEVDTGWRVDHSKAAQKVGLPKASRHQGWRASAMKANGTLMEHGGQVRIGTVEFADSIGRCPIRRLCRK